ncbi:MAG: thiamine pyrophosphate-dependent enzyme [Desulfuromusa sp.]|nr:thiamine pyrophosphate-dependent enzyme [Desulfuromusa sp.]
MDHSSVNFDGVEKSSPYGVAALYSSQALWTAAHEKLPVTFIVVNNREYNVLKNFMRTQPHVTSAQQNKVNQQGSFVYQFFGLL